MENTPNSFDPNLWIEHIKHPLVLFGFVLLLLATLLKLFNGNKLNASGTERVMSKGLLYTFVAAVLIIILGFVSSVLQNAPQPKVDQQSKGVQSENAATNVPNSADVKQTSENDQSPNKVDFAR